MNKSIDFRKYIRYQIKSFIDFVIDWDGTPGLLVDTQYPGVRIPENQRDKPVLLLNISAESVKNFTLNNEYVSFTTHFDGQDFDVYLPVLSIQAVTNIGTNDAYMLITNFFRQQEAQAAEMEKQQNTEAENPKPEKPSLQVVK